MHPKKSLSSRLSIFYYQESLLNTLSSVDSQPTHSRINWTSFLPVNDRSKKVHRGDSKELEIDFVRKLATSERHHFVIETRNIRHQIDLQFSSKFAATEFFRGFTQYLKSDREPADGTGLTYAVRGSRFAVFWEVFASLHNEMRNPECCIFDSRSNQVTKSFGDNKKETPEQRQRYKDKLAKAAKQQNKVTSYQSKLKTNPNQLSGSSDDTGGTMLQIGAVHWLSE